MSSSPDPSIDPSLLKYHHFHVGNDPRGPSGALEVMTTYDCGVWTYSSDGVHRLYFKYRNSKRGFYLYGSSHSEPVQTLDGQIYTIGKSYSMTKIQALLAYALPIIEVMDEHPYISIDTPMSKIPAGINWSKVVTKLSELGKIQLRMTDHEFRGDSRDITHIGGEAVGSISVDGLYWDKPTQSRLLALLNEG